VGVAKGLVVTAVSVKGERRTEKRPKMPFTSWKGLEEEEEEEEMAVVVVTLDGKVGGGGAGSFRNTSITAEML